MGVSTQLPLSLSLSLTFNAFSCRFCAVFVSLFFSLYSSIFFCLCHKRNETFRWRRIKDKVCVTCSQLTQCLTPLSLPHSRFSLLHCHLKHFTVHLCVAVLAAKNFVCLLWTDRGRKGRVRRQRNMSGRRWLCQCRRRRAGCSVSERVPL